MFSQGGLAPFLVHSGPSSDTQLSMECLFVRVTNLYAPNIAAKFVYQNVSTPTSIGGIITINIVEYIVAGFVWLYRLTGWSGLFL